jgi:HK97 family phage portal protein
MSVLDLVFGSIETSVSDIRNPRLWLQEWAAGGRATATGQYVGPETAMQLSCYFAAIRNISEDVAKVPLITYRRLSPRGKARATDHPIYTLLHDSPNPEMGSMAFREALNQAALGWGNGYAHIRRNRKGLAEALYPIHPSRVEIKRDKKTRGLFYKVNSDPGALARDIPQAVAYEPSEIFHVHGLGSDGLQGYSVARLAAESLGLGLSMQEWAARFFGQGTTTSGIVTHPEKISDEAYKRLSEEWKEARAGLPNAWKTMILEEGMEWKPIAIPPEDSQLLQSRRFTVEEMARWFRIPPHKLQHLDRATFNNIESLNIQYVGDSLHPWMARWEEEILRKLLNSNPEMFAEHLVVGLLRGDEKSRSTFYAKMFAIGTMSQNDIRDAENQNPIDDGDVYYVPSNLTRSEDAAQGIVASAKGSRGARREPADNDRPDSRQAMFPVFADAAARVLRKEMRAASRALSRYEKDDDGFAAWLEKFYAEHQEYLIEAFRAPAVVLAELSGKPAVAPQERLQLFSAAHADESRELLLSYHRRQNGNGLGGWLSARAEMMATKLLEVYLKWQPNTPELQ